MDVVSILRKAGKALKNFNVKVTGEISKHVPIEYVSIHLDYEFEGDEEVKYAALQAVQDSQEKYCGVSNMLRKIMPVTWDVLYNGAKIFSYTDTRQPEPQD
jgi:putative redox protein